MDFEAWVERHHEEALRLGIVSCPVEHNEPHWRKVRGRWERVAPGVADYTGVLYDGHGSSLATEAKSRRRRIYLRDVTPKQRRHLGGVARGGGLAFLLARICDDRGRSLIEAAVPWQDVPWRVEQSAEGVVAEDLEPWRIPPGRDCYLEPYCSVRGTPVPLAEGGPPRRFPRE